MSNHAPKQSQPDELIGRVINDRFRILSVIARGGMGRVYRAEQVPLGRLVAVKTLDPRHVGGDQDPQFQQRFFLEASVASKLQHPNTVTVFDYGRTSDGIYFIAMELVEGRSLLHTIREDGPFPPARAIHIALQIARSLREAHRLDVIHRDLKPGNVLLTRHGDEEDFVKVLDFGLVKHVETEHEQELTKAGLFMGSPKYMAPEQIRGDRVDARCDVYALGVVMYEMLAGKVPFERENTVKVLMAHMHEQAPPIQLHAPECPPALADLVMRCLAKLPEERPASMDELILLLKQSTGAPALLSGQFQLSQEIQLGGTPSGALSGGTLSGGTPSHAFMSGTHTLPPGTNPMAGASGNFAQPVASSASVPPPAPPAQAGWLPKLVVIGALGIAGGFLALRFSERNSDAERGTAPPSPAAATSPSAQPEPVGREVPAAPVEEAPQHKVLVTINSVPAGAKVLVDGKPYGQTPADIEWWGEQAEPGREVTIMLQKDGYEKVTLVRSIMGDKLAVEATLPRIAAPSRRRAPAEPRTPRAPVLVPDDFKTDPY